MPESRRDSHEWGEQDSSYRGHGYIAPDVLPCTVSEQGVPVPIIYGRCKVPLLLIEKYAPQQAPYPDWQASHAYYINDHVRHVIGYYDGVTYYYVYQCITAGTSAGSGGPVTEDNDITDGTVHWGFTGGSSSDMQVMFQDFLGVLGEGEIVGIVGMWMNKTYSITGVTNRPGWGLIASIGPDNLTQTLPGTYDSSGYQHTAVVYPADASSTSSGTGTEIPDLAFAVEGVMFNTPAPCVSPADIIYDLVTHSRRGCNMSSGIIDTSITGSGATTYRTYCDAAGFRIGLYIDEQRKCLDIITDILRATNSEGFWSQGLLKIIPRGDVSITTPVYGAVNYVPTKTAVYNLTTNDFIGSPPIRVRRLSDADVYNAWPVDFFDASQGWAKTTYEDPDQSDIERRGFRRAGNTAVNIVYADGQPAITLSRILAQRSVYIRNQYTFKLLWKYLRLEPTDIVTLTDPVLGISLLPVKILELTETADGIDVLAEDYPAGASHTVSYSPQPNSGYIPNHKRTTQDLTMSRFQDTSLYRRVKNVSVANTAVSASIANNAVTAPKVLGSGVTGINNSMLSTKPSLNRNTNFIQR